MYIGCCNQVDQSSYAPTLPTHLYHMLRACGRVCTEMVHLVLKGTVAVQRATLRMQAKAPFQELRDRRPL